MALKITYDCIACAACVEDCPQQAISEGEGIFVIDWERCVECAGHHETPQCVAICPVDACVPDPEHVESREVLLAKKDRLSRGVSGTQP